MAKAQRIGVMMPSTSPTVEPDFYTVVPVSTGVSVHFERMYNGRWGNQPEKPEDDAYFARLTAEERAETDSWMLIGADNRMMNADVERCARSLANVKPDVIVYACTAGTWLKNDLAFDREMAERISRASGGIPCVTAFGASLDALRFVGARRVGIASPYWTGPMRERLKPLMEQVGFEVASAEGTPETQGSAQPKAVDEQDPEAILEFVARVTPAEADAVFLPGTAWRALAVAERLEQRLGKTVITATQATIWRALSLIGRTDAVPGFGRLLRSIPPPSGGAGTVRAGRAAAVAAR